MRKAKQRADSAADDVDMLQCVTTQHSKSEYKADVRSGRNQARCAVQMDIASQDGSADNGKGEGTGNGTCEGADEG